MGRLTYLQCIVAFDIFVMKIHLFICPYHHMNLDLIQKALQFSVGNQNVLTYKDKIT